MRGYRTYVLAGIIAAAAVAKWLDLIDDATYQMILGLTGGTGLYTLRSGIASDATKMELKLDTIAVATKTPPVIPEAKPVPIPKK